MVKPFTCRISQANLGFFWVVCFFGFFLSCTICICSGIQDNLKFMEPFLLNLRVLVMFLYSLKVNESRNTTKL